MLLLYNYHRKDCAFHGYDYEWMHEAKKIFSKNIHSSDCGIQISNLINLYLIYNNLYWSHISFLKNESRLVMPCIYIYKYIYENFHCQGRNADMMSSIIICLQNKGMVYWTSHAVLSLRKTLWRTIYNICSVSYFWTNLNENVVK